MKTVTLLIGNSDNKLTQVEWTRYCRDIEYVVNSWRETKEFSAPSIGWLAYQNACWVFTIKFPNIEKFKNEIIEIRKKYFQTSVAIIVGETEFI